MSKRSSKHSRRNERSFGDRFRAFLREAIFLFAAVLGINSFLMAGFEVPTASMEDTVKVGDRLFVNKLAYGGTTPYSIPLTGIRIPHLRVPGFRSVERGDVIVFDWPGPRDQVEKPPQVFYLKRCVGLPGDSVEIRDRAVFVNGRRFPDPPHSKFIRGESAPRGAPNPDIFPKGAPFNEDQYGPIVVPRKGMEIRLDSRNLLLWEVFIRREGHRAEAREGRVWIDGVPTDQYRVERDYVFALGDSRDNSLDSRFWGFIPMEDVIGTPMFVYWSWDLRIPIYRIADRLRSIVFRRIGTPIS